MIEQLLIMTAALFSILPHAFAQDATLPLRNIVYLEGETFNQRLDLYLPPANETLAPTVVILHGSRGNKSEYRSWAEHLTQRGYAVIVPNHRTLPSQTSDGFCSVAWAHDNVETYGLDPDHIFIIGWSFGGGVAAEVGTIDSDIDPFTEHMCPYSIPETWTAGTVLLAAASAQSQGPEWHKTLPPLTWLDGSEKPFLLIHGAMDNQVPVGVSGYLAAELEAAGVPVKLLIMPEVGHFFPLYGEGRDRAWQEVDNFLDEQIG